MEKVHYDFHRQLLHAKSPHQMLGVLAEDLLRKKLGLDPAKIYVASFMP